MSQIEKEEKKRIKEKLTNNVDSLISILEQRIAERQKVFDYENEKDNNKLNELLVQQEGLLTLK